MSLAQRSVRSITWNTLSSLIALPTNFLQSILLARLLPVEYFGVFAGVSSLISIMGTFFEFGFGNAYLHRSDETADEEEATSGLFTLRLIFDTFWLISMVVIGMATLEGLNRYTFSFLAISSFLYRFTFAPRMLLIRRVKHRRLALLDLTVGITTSIVSVLIAFFTHSIWALLSSSFITLFISVIGVYVYDPVWKPHILWARPLFKYYINFGAKNLVNNLLEALLENIDNLWTSIFLGDLLLGYYSRAFKFAIYPRTLLSAPVNAVILGTYAELKHERYRLSRAFFQTNAFLIRTGFLLAGWLVVIAPYFIRLLIGVRWMPMLSAFRLMMIFAMLDPIKVTISSVLVAVGVPEKISVVRIAQFITMVAGLFWLGLRYQIAGVALSIDLMVIVGTAMLLYFARKYVDVSLLRMFLAPAVALGAALLLSWIADQQIDPSLSDWLVAIIKTAIFGVTYLAVLFAMEGRALIQNLKEIGQVFSLKEGARALFKISSKES